MTKDDPNWYGPLPNCCAAIRRTLLFEKRPRIFLYVPVEEDYQIVDHVNNVVYRWKDNPGAMTPLEKEIVHDPIPQDYDFPDPTLGTPRWVYGKDSIEISFCPHCGTKLPEVEPDPTFTDTLVGIEGECQTGSDCKMNTEEAYWDCNCRPLGARYRIRQ